MVGLASPRVTGLERYGIELIRALLAAAPPQLEIVPYVHGWAAKHVTARCRVVPEHLARPVAIEAWLPVAAHRDKCDLLHVTAYGAPSLARLPFTMTLHDTITWQLPDSLSRGARLYFKPLTERSLRSRLLRGLVTNATSTQQEASERFGVTVPSVVAGNGCSPFWSPDDPPVRGAQPGRLRILSVGTVEPRKGLDLIPSAIRSLTARGLLVDWRLVGRQGWGATVPDRTTMLGILSDDELREEYCAADVVRRALAHGRV